MIAEWFLWLALFLPRIALLIAYCNDLIPTNTMPFAGDVLLSIFLPRILICFYIYENLGTASGWFAAHIVAAGIAYIFALARQLKRS
jgi:hypothetical protein